MGLVLDKGLNLMVDGMCQQSPLYLVAYSEAGGATKQGDAVVVTFGAAVGGVAAMTGGDRTIANIPSSTNITYVRLQDSTASQTSALALAEDPILAVFDDGGDLNIKTFGATVT
jgi:hypothetical protein